ncbi:phosphotransferase [Lipomyces tetrasporus]|uniref:Phosphotransferase n=1 Tax=Lipomyces tetrasporus TaxID=54092 RepID=A0AAD7VQE7_9ASCO|nr:phosphotransferase [Lipomyces tetrasporus]KAJ8097811.1 phosphotransferase [Lipomyces tetrasporus]
MANINHEGYQDRLALVEDILRKYGLQPTDVTPVAYEKDCPFPYNNFIYKVELTEPVTPSSFSDAPSCTVRPVSVGVSKVIIRLSNPKAGGLNHLNRVENEVAAMYLARKGLGSFKPGLEAVIPAVYAWQAGSSATGGLSWLLMEYKAGVQLDEQFNFLSETEKKNVIEQIADVFSGIQRCELPEGVDCYGGLSVDGEGKVVSGEMTTLKGGPWKGYDAFWQARLVAQLKNADESSALEGWRPNGVRERIEGFLVDGLSEVFAKAGVDIRKRVLVHGDLTMNNMLIDPNTNNLTALLDFDFSFIAPPAHEFFTSLQDLGGNTGGVHGPDPTEGRLSKALLTGNFDVEDIPEAGKGLWIKARNWDEAMARRRTVRPSEIQGIEVLDRLRKLEGLICPFRLVHPVFLKKQTNEEIAEARAKAEKMLVEELEHYGH